MSRAASPIRDVAKATPRSAPVLFGPAAQLLGELDHLAVGDRSVEEVLRHAEVRVEQRRRQRRVPAGTPQLEPEAFEPLPALVRDQPLQPDEVDVAATGRRASSSGCAPWPQRPRPRRRRRRSRPGCPGPAGAARRRRRPRARAPPAPPRRSAGRSVKHAARASRARTSRCSVPVVSDTAARYASTAAGVAQGHQQVTSPGQQARPVLPGRVLQHRVDQRERVAVGPERAGRLDRRQHVRDRLRAAARPRAAGGRPGPGPRPGPPAARRPARRAAGTARAAACRPATRHGPGRAGTGTPVSAGSTTRAARAASRCGRPRSSRRPGHGEQLVGGERRAEQRDPPERLPRPRSRQPGVDGRPLPASGRPAPAPAPRTAVRR